MCSANWNLGSDLEFPRKNVTRYWLSNAHKSSIIDIVQINKVKFNMGEDMKLVRKCPRENTCFGKPHDVSPPQDGDSMSTGP